MTLGLAGVLAMLAEVVVLEVAMLGRGRIEMLRVSKTFLGNSSILNLALLRREVITGK